MKKTALPPLAFGNDIAIVHECAQDFGDLIEKSFPGMNAYDPLTDVKSFRSKSATLVLPHAKVVASAISPTYVDRNSSGVLTFMLPFAGKGGAFSQVGERRVDWGPGLGGMFLPKTDERVIGSGGFRSQIMWQLNRELLEKTAQTMLGTHDAVDLQLDLARQLPRDVQGVSTDAAFQSLLPILELHRRQPEILGNLGIEDLIYRQSVMLLRPDLFSGEAAKEPVQASVSRPQQLLTPLCEFIVAHLSEPLTLTDLEQVSGMSARSLQLAFNSQYGCTPMSWVREQRLLRVRQVLMSRSDAPVEALALSMGFQTMPAFFQAYKKRFGETPGQTKSLVRTR